MKIQGLMFAAVVLIAGCAKPPAARLVEVEMAPMEVGTKTPDYEVVAPNALQLAPGVKTEPVKDANGNQAVYDWLAAINHRRQVLRCLGKRLGA